MVLTFNVFFLSGKLPAHSTKAQNAEKHVLLFLPRRPRRKFKLKVLKAACAILLSDHTP